MGVRGEGGGKVEGKKFCDGVRIVEEVGFEYVSMDLFEFDFF